VKGQRFLFTGKELDEETGLVYFGARYLDAAKARWLTFDPEIRDRPAGTSGPRSSNLYGYANNAPVALTDPNGRECVPTQNGLVDCFGNYNRYAAMLNDQAGAAWRDGRYGEWFVTGILLTPLEPVGRYGSLLEQLVVDAAVNPGLMLYYGYRDNNERLKSDGGFLLFVGVYAAWENRFARGVGVVADAAASAATSEGGFDMALGVARHGTSGSPTLLNNFASRTGAKTYKDIFGS
jgi:RHS repeat-associated protein